MRKNWRILIGGKVGNYVQVVFKPIWFNKEMSISAISGLVAKEITVSTLWSLYYIQDWDTNSLINKLKDQIKCPKFFLPNKVFWKLIYLNKSLGNNEPILCQAKERK